ncbi:MAG: alpha/beta hydrolase [Planctomycetia bacterium 21-64-5]|nr:MAG: alpha/beta hydrolase [Planctomycetia bacterium 21-64-5]HQU45363.1 alpha/beta fold hydrolase [Pirellulales bacterium]
MSDEPNWRALYPFESHWLDLDGIRYHYLDEGQGEPLLLVHGNPTWSFYWREIIKGLRGKYRLIVPDHVGCGLSDKPQQYEYRLARHIDNLRRLIDHLRLDNVTLLAHDWGGAIGLGAAVAGPERFGRFVLFNTAAFRSHRIPLRIRLCRTPLLGELAVRGLNAFARAALTMAVAKHERMTPQVRAGLLAPYDSWASRTAIHRFVMDIPLSPRHPSCAALETIEQGLAKLRERPVMLIWGMQDWCFTPHFLERFLEFFPEAEVRRLFDASHYVIEDAHEQIVPLVERFLAQHARRRPFE